MLEIFRMMFPLRRFDKGIPLRGTDDQIRRAYRRCDVDDGVRRRIADCVGWQQGVSGRLVLRIT
jgi:hypothetical protein